MINEDSTLLISGSDDGIIAVFPILQLLDVSSNDHESDQLVLYKVADTIQHVTCIALGPAGCNSTMVSTSHDGTCQFWRLTDGSHLQTIQFPCPIWCITMDPTDSVVYVGGSDGQVHAIPLKCRGRRHQGKVAVWEAEPAGAVMAVAMVNGNKNLVSASEEGIIRIWEVESRSIIQVLGHERDGTVSDLLVATGFSCGRIKDEAAKWNGVQSLGFCEREVYRKNREVQEMEERLGAVVKDRRRAIDMLEVTIETYERLLGLLLKEAKGGEHREEVSNELNSSL